jgi:membrane protease YdiL (CAAX protease family)
MADDRRIPDGEGRIDAPTPQAPVVAGPGLGQSVPPPLRWTNADASGESGADRVQRPFDGHLPEAHAAPGRPLPGGWQVPNAWPTPQPSGQWQPTPYGGWQNTQPGPWSAPNPWPAPNAWAAPSPWPAASAWPALSVWPPGFVPWGYVSVPPIAPVLEPPGRFHPQWRRSVLSLKGRASPHLYLLGLILGLPGLAALLLFWLGARSGLHLTEMQIPAPLLVEIVSALAAVGLLGACIAQARQRRADGWRDYAGPAPLLAGAALIALVTCLYLPVEFGLSEAGIHLSVGLSTLLQVLIYLATYAGVVHLVAVRTGALTWRDILRPRKLAPSQDAWHTAPKPAIVVDPWGRPTGVWRSRVAGGYVGDVLWALALLLPLFFITALLSALLAVALGLRSSDLTSPVTTTVTDLDRWITILAVAVLVPIGEEIFYRGLAANAWGRSLSRNSAIVRSALFFAAVHILNTTSTEAGLSLRSAFFNMAVRVPIAIALTWLYMRRRSLVSSATLHGSYNGLIVMIGILASY